MFAQYFGQFLLSQELITSNELERALNAQKDTRVKLGVLAINKGYLTAEQVDTVHQAQTRMDKRFGEIAIELGYIQEDVINELLSAQPSAHLALGQALIDHEIMRYEDFSSALFKYKQENSLSDEQFQSIVNGNIETIVEALLLKEGIARDSILIDYISLFAKNVIRFVDTDIRLEIGQTKQSSHYDWVAQQLIQSEDYSVEQTTAIAGTEQSFLRFASKYAQEDVDAPGELFEAAIGEFLNLHNGIYLVNRSNDGVELNLLPQTFEQGSSFVANSADTTVIQIVGSDFTIDLFISDLSKLHI